MLNLERERLYDRYIYMDFGSLKNECANPGTDIKVARKQQTFEFELVIPSPKNDRNRSKKRTFR